MKRLFDLVASATVLIVASPVLAATAVAIRILIGAPVLFRQERTGFNGEPFEIIKFRTMLDAHDAGGAQLPDSERRHWFGDLLRRTSLDELPTLLNVLVGDMSVVGPRPLLHRYLPRYDSRQIRRFETRPGLTGLAQINGRNAVEWEPRLEFDVQYVEQRSFLVDLRILVATIRLVVHGEGADGIDHTTEFFGTEQRPGAELGGTAS